MKFKLDENIFDFLNKNDLDNLNEDLELPVADNQVLYEDEDFSKTPAEADNYRTAAEDILGFELDGNQVEYLATEWPALYHDSEKLAAMKDSILKFMDLEGLLKDNQKVSFDFDDDIDYTEEPASDALHPTLNSENTNKGFSPLQVLSWDTPTEDPTKPKDNTDAMLDMANELVDDDDFDLEDRELLNNILARDEKK